MSAFHPFLPLSQQFVEGQDRHIRCAGCKKSRLAGVDVAKFQVFFTLFFDFAGSIEDCEHSEKGRSCGF